MDCMNQNGTALKKRLTQGRIGEVTVKLSEVDTIGKPLALVSFKKKCLLSISDLLKDVLAMFRKIFAVVNLRISLDIRRMYNVHVQGRYFVLTSVAVFNT